MSFPTVVSTGSLRPHHASLMPQIHYPVMNRPGYLGRKLFPNARWALQSGTFSTANPG